MNTSVTSRGFTIVELLIVIVVIAILAAISIVAYTGIQNRAHNTALQSDLRTVGGQILLDQTLSDSGQPATADATGLTGKVKVSKHSYNTTGISSGQFAYCRNNEYFALLARSKTNVTYVYRSIGGTIGTVSNTGHRALAGPKCHFHPTDSQIPSQGRRCRTSTSRNSHQPARPMQSAPLPVRQTVAA